MSELLRSAAIRRIEAAAMAALPAGTLMARAADAVAEAAAALARSLAPRRPILAWVGPGNNGGDALLAAMRLREHGFAVRAIALDPLHEPGGDAGSIWQRARAQGLAIEGPAAWTTLLDAQSRRSAAGMSGDERAPIVLDGLFGIGLRRALDPPAASICAALARLGWPVVAVDVPSGIDADTGAVAGAAAGGDAVAIRARITVTMIADKPGLHTGAARDHTGEVRVADLGIGEATRRLALAGTSAGEVGQRFGRVAAGAAALPPRRPDTSKGSYGSVLCYGGAPHLRGAVLLAARGAQAIGAGRIHVATPDGELFDPGQPQWMTAAPETGFDGFDAVAIGCGLGISPAARASVARAIAQARALVVDADALNALAADQTLARALAQRPGARPCIVTPHPLEAARLLATTVAHIQSDRIAAAGEIARRLNAVALLKGAGTVVATPDGGWTLIDSGSAALASAGTGDVLAGICAALLARTADPGRAACLGAWLHGRAGERWEQANGGADGLSAAELAHWVRGTMAQLHTTEANR